MTLGDQVRILTIELKKLGHDVSVVMPFYRSVREGKYVVRPTNGEFQVNLGGKRASSDIVETISPDGIQVYLIRRDEYFDRSGIYGADGRLYEDNAERFIFFSKAVLELASRISPSPELIHCHDWTTALIPIFVRDRQMPFRTVLTVHNLEHQGSFWSFDFALTGLPGSYFGPRGLEFYGRLNFLKGGILAADAVTFPGEEALFKAFTPQHGFGLDSVLQENRFHLFGIPHGVDYSLKPIRRSINWGANARNPKPVTENRAPGKHFWIRSSWKEIRTELFSIFQSNRMIRVHSAPSNRS